MMQSVKEGNTNSNHLSMRKRTGSLIPNQQQRHHVGDSFRIKDGQTTKMSSDSTDNIKAIGTKTSKSSTISGEVLCRACEQPIKGLVRMSS